MTRIMTASNPAVIRRQITPRLKEDMLTLRREGVSNAGIAKQLGISYNMVLNHIGAQPHTTTVMLRELRIKQNEQRRAVQKSIAAALRKEEAEREAERRRREEEERKRQEEIRLAEEVVLRHQRLCAKKVELAAACEAVDKEIAAMADHLRRAERFLTDAKKEAAKAKNSH